MALKVYLAGKIAREDWRHSIVPELAHFHPDEHGQAHWDARIEGGVYGGHDYVGPHFKAVGGHGYGHGENTHGNDLGGLLDRELSIYSMTGIPRYDGAVPHSKGQLAQYCRIQIDRADLVFVWLDDATAYGTLVEIGWAAARDKAIWIAGYPIEDLWFALTFADRTRLVQRPGETALDCWREMVAEHGPGLESELRYTASWKENKRQADRDVERFIEYAKQTKPNQLRAEVWRKTGGKCWYCGVLLNPFENFHIEHMQPKSKGGLDTLDNLAPACRTCNLSKGGLTVDEFRWKRGGGKFHFELAAEGAA